MASDSDDSQSVPEPSSSDIGIDIPEPPPTTPGDPPQSRPQSRPSSIDPSSPTWSLAEALMESQRQAKEYTLRFDRAVKELEQLLPALRVAFDRDPDTDKGIFMMGDASHVWMQIETSQPKHLIEMLEALAKEAAKDKVGVMAMGFTKDMLFSLLQRAYAFVKKKPASTMPMVIGKEPGVSAADVCGNYPAAITVSPEVARVLMGQHTPGLDPNKLS